MSKSYKMPTFYVVGENPLITHMMSVWGYNKVRDIKDALIVVFGGGPDLNPMFYGERLNVNTKPDFVTDMRDIKAYRSLNDEQIPVGICRGAQFLNVFAGNGKLYQDVDNHSGGSGYHYAQLSTLATNGEVPMRFKVSSTHHQMMIPGPAGDVWMFAHESSLKFGEDSIRPLVRHKGVTDMYDDMDPEVIYYYTTAHQHGVLCYQPHPEYMEDETNDINTQTFFYLLEEYLVPKKFIEQIEDNRSKRLPNFLTKRDERIDLRNLEKIAKEVMSNGTDVIIKREALL